LPQTLLPLTPEVDGMTPTLAIADDAGATALEPRLQNDPGPVAPRCPRYQSLDVWRGVACLAVVVFHSTQFAVTYENDQGLRTASLARWLAAGTSRLWVGVPMFFVISGYCISATADSSRRKGQGTGTYFLRRFRRIYPPYWAYFGVLAVSMLLLDRLLKHEIFTGPEHRIMRPWWLSVPDLIGNVTLTETWLRHFFHNRHQMFVWQGWTLCYEEQFYAVVGITLLVARRHLFKVMMLTTAAVLAMCLAFDMTPIRGFFFDGRWLLFAAGILVYYVINYASHRESAVLKLLLVLGMFWACSHPYRIREFIANQEQERLAAFGFALLLLWLHPSDRRLHASRWLGPVAFCGRISYSLYLTHSPMVLFISWAAYKFGATSLWTTMLVVVPLCVACAIPVAWTFYQLVERRCLNTVGV
jgi:peptidoglycan/LPS O-acetylase OafA/YrhL